MVVKIRGILLSFSVEEQLGNWERHKSTSHHAYCSASDCSRTKTDFNLVFDANTRASEDNTIEPVSNFCSGAAAEQTGQDESIAGPWQRRQD